MDNITKLNKGAVCCASALLVATVIDSNNPRELLFPKIIAKALDYCIIHISPQEVDTLNVFKARMEGFKEP